VKIEKWRVETWDKDGNKEWLSVEAATAERAEELAQSEGDVDRVGKVRKA